jgi:hypothetical protein
VPILRSSAVPNAVPSLTQSSTSLADVEAAKNNLPFAAARLVGFDEFAPNTMSLTTTVPSLAVAFPDLQAVEAIVGHEIERIPQRRQLRGIGAGGAGANVLDKDGSQFGAVAFPEFDAIDAVVGREKERIAETDEVGWGGA